MSETKKENVAIGWQLIELLGLNEKIKLGTQRKLHPRFSLISKVGYSLKAPAEGAAIFDMLLGKTFLPQLDAEWLDQLMTRYRVGTEWDPVAECWIAYAGPHRNTLAKGQGATPGFAVVTALVEAAKNNCLPPKHPMPNI